MRCVCVFVCVCACVRVCVEGEGSACVWFLRLLWSGLLPRLVKEDVATFAGC